MWNRIKREEDILNIDDLDHQTLVQLKKVRDLFEGEDEELYETRTVTGLMTGEGLVTSSEDIGPMCAHKRCTTRLSMKNLRHCDRCEKPLCRIHSKKRRDKHYCRHCLRVVRLQSVMSWLLTPTEVEE